MARFRVQPVTKDGAAPLVCAGGGGGGWEADPPAPGLTATGAGGLGGGVGEGLGGGTAGGGANGSATLGVRGQVQEAEVLYL